MQSSPQLLQAPSCWLRQVAAVPDLMSSLAESAGLGQHGHGGSQGKDRARQDDRYAGAGDDGASGAACGQTCGQAETGGQGKRRRWGFRVSCHGSTRRARVFAVHVWSTTIFGCSGLRTCRFLTC